MLTEASPEASRHERLTAPVAKALATMVRPHGVGVISDIDDTVKVPSFTEIIARFRSI